MDNNRIIRNIPINPQSVNFDTIFQSLTTIIGRQLEKTIEINYLKLNESILKLNLKLQEINGQMNLGINNLEHKVANI
jgi:hypothetical protein